MQESVYLGLGSNRDNRLSYLVQVLRLFRQTPAIELCRFSSIYETEPYGVKNQRDFLNIVVEINTDFTPGKLLQCLQFIERKVGRINRGVWASREIDIDILALGNKIIQLPWLTVPHAELHKRRFVLTPFAEISPDFVLPKFNRPVQSLLTECQDHCRVKKHIAAEEIEMDWLTAQERVLV